MACVAVCLLALANISLSSLPQEGVVYVAGRPYTYSNWQYRNETASVDLADAVKTHYFGGFLKLWARVPSVSVSAVMWGVLDAGPWLMAKSPSLRVYEFGQWVAEGWGRRVVEHKAPVPVVWYWAVVNEARLIWGSCVVPWWLLVALVAGIRYKVIRLTHVCAWSSALVAELAGKEITPAAPSNIIRRCSNLNLDEREFTQLMNETIRAFELGYTKPVEGFRAGVVTEALGVPAF